MTPISVYEPTMTRPGDVKEKFCKDLKAAIKSLCKVDKLIIFKLLFKPWFDVQGDMTGVTDEVYAATSNLEC